MTKKTLAWLVVMVWAFALRSEAALVIEPAYVTMDLNQDRNSGAFIIKNTSDQEERYRAKAVHFVVPENGGLAEVPANEYSLANWVKFNPKEFVLPPNSSRMVRFSIIPDTKLKNREYWGAIEFTPLQVAHVTSKDEKGRTFNLQVSNVILVPIYGFGKGIPYSGQVKEISVKREKDILRAIVKLENTGEGNLRFDGDLKIIDARGQMLEEVPLQKIIVFTKNSRILKIKLSKVADPGNYIARINFKSSEEHSKAGIAYEAKFTL